MAVELMGGIEKRIKVAPAQQLVCIVYETLSLGDDSWN